MYNDWLQPLDVRMMCFKTVSSFKFHFSLVPTIRGKKKNLIQGTQGSCMKYQSATSIAFKAGVSNWFKVTGRVLSSRMGQTKKSKIIK